MHQMEPRGQSTMISNGLLLVTSEPLLPELLSVSLPDSLPEPLSSSAADQASSRLAAGQSAADSQHMTGIR